MKKDNKFYTYNLLAGIILICVCFHTTIAQPVLSVTASKNTIRTGEPDTIQLRADWQGHPLRQGFIVPDSFPHFEVWDKGAAVSNENGVTQNIVVASYDSGRFNLPPLELLEMKNSKTDSFAINVQPVNVDSLKDYHDIKDIIEVPPVPQWPFVLFITALTLISLVALYFLLRRTRLGEERASNNVKKLGAFERAIEALQKLEPQSTQTGLAKPFFTTLTGIYRTYLHEAYRYRSMQQTGGELLLQAKPLLQEENFYQLANAIRLSDAVKFAKYEPAQSDWTTSLTAIRQALEELNRQQKEATNNALNISARQKEASNKTLTLKK
jgi:hypothetical protein